jgi:integrase
MLQLGGGERIFCSRAGTTVNPGNALKRYVRPAATGLGIAIGGWHDFRHTMTTQMRSAGIHPVLISAILGHSKVDLAMNVYDRASVDELKQPLTYMGNELYRSVPKSQAAGLHLVEN